MSSLPSHWNIILWTGRLLIWFSFLLSGAWLVFSFAFPSASFAFDFRNPSASKNTLSNPRTIDGDPRGNGRLKKNETLLIDASPFGDFTTARFQIARESDALSPIGSNVTVRRSQKVFFYPEGAIATFPAGSLLRNNDQYFLIAEDGSRRPFSSETAVQNFGYAPDTFLETAHETIAQIPIGMPIIDGSLPDDILITSDGNFYIKKNGLFTPFSSREAFLAAFPESWALSKDTTFIQSSTLSDNFIGFPSGSLLAFADGVFLMDGNTPRAIGSVDIFNSLGYDWNDVIPVNDEDINLSQKGKIVDFSASHPEGTILLDTDTDQYFLIMNHEKHLIESDTIRNAWLRNRHPILVSSRSLTTFASCIFENESWFTKTSQCTLSLAPLETLPGNSYEFSIHTPNGTDIRSAQVTFGSAITHDTVLLSLSKLKQRILSRYVPTP